MTSGFPINSETPDADRDRLDEEDPNSSAPDSGPELTEVWQQGALVELTIADLADTGEGVGRWQGRAVFVPDAVPGDRLLVRLVHTKPNLARGQIQEILTASDDRVRPACIVADKCGGCEWQAVSYPAQLAAKQKQVEQALIRIGKFAPDQVAQIITPIIPAPAALAYRNKSTYPVAPGPEKGEIRAGYYRKGSHRLVNLNQCPVQDQRLDTLLGVVKADIAARGWPAYDEARHRGVIRHLSLRVGRQSGEQLLTIVATRADLPGAKEQAQAWRERFPELVGVSINVNAERNNVIFGKDTYCLDGREWLLERLDSVELAIRGDTFFQVNTEQTATAIGLLREALHLSERERVIDAYCGVGTLVLPLANQLEWAIGLEVQPEAVGQATNNARRNGIDNVEFRAGSVESTLMTAAQDLRRVDVVLLDPPRRGCDRSVIESLRSIVPDRIAYMSCKPSSLCRDLALLCEDGLYTIDRVHPLDFFPQTPHVESLAILHRN